MKVYAASSRRPARALSSVRQFPSSRCPPSLGLHTPKRGAGGRAGSGAEGRPDLRALSRGKPEREVGLWAPHAPVLFPVLPIEPLIHSAETPRSASHVLGSCTGPSSLERETRAGQGQRRGGRGQLCVPALCAPPAYSPSHALSPGLRHPHSQPHSDEVNNQGVGFKYQLARGRKPACQKNKTKQKNEQEENST